MGLFSFSDNDFNRIKILAYDPEVSMEGVNGTLHYAAAVTATVATAALGLTAAYLTL